MTSFVTSLVVSNKKTITFGEYVLLATKRAMVTVYYQEHLTNR